jgi:uncharacterized membrane protein HdeD (DUF308 family)
MLILEGSVNLAAAAAVLVWQSVAAVALVPIATAWAVISGGLLLAAAHRLSGSEGRWILVVAGVVSAGWLLWWRSSAPATRGRWDCGWWAMR